MKTFFKHLFTEPDNSTFCPIRVVAILAVLQYLGMGMAHYIQHAVFDAQPFALGLGGLIGGVGAALKLKKDTPASDSTGNG